MSQAFEPSRGRRLPSLVDEGACFEGLASFRGEARVDGEVRGELFGEGFLLVGPRGRVRARVEVDELVVRGRIEGEVRARQRVELLPGAHVCGVIHAPRLAVAEGALVEAELAIGADAVGRAGP